ncbi:MAG: hypothetical protein RID53_31035 [Coleofasciculus sp. B1-GNL1-01]
MTNDKSPPLPCQQCSLLQFNLNLLSIEVDRIEIVLGQVNHPAHQQYGRG